MARDATQSISPSASAPTSAPEGGTAGEVYYLVPHIDGELDIAEAWHAKNRAGLEDDRFTPLLPLTMLHKSSVIYVLCRKIGKGRQAKLRELESFRWVKGEQEFTSLTVEELAEDMQPYGPIVCADHWDDTGRWNSKLNRLSFMEAFQRLASPYAVRWMDLGACKHTLPNELYITYV